MNTQSGDASRPGKPLVLLSHGRSGTNFLISKLLLTKKVLFGWEPFNHGFYAYGGFEHFNVPEEVKARMQDKSFRDSDPDGYISYCSGLTGALDGTGVALSGFKIFPPHNREIYLKMTKDVRFRALVLQRRSLLSVYSSHLIAVQTSKWTANKKTAAEQTEQIKVEFIAEKFEKFADTYRADFDLTVANLVDAGVEYKHIYYEELVADPAVFSGVLDYCGLPSAQVKDSWLVKQNTSDVLERFSNPAAVQPYLEAENEQERALAGRA